MTLMKLFKGLEKPQQVRSFGSITDFDFLPNAAEKKFCRLSEEKKHHSTRLGFVFLHEGFMKTCTNIQLLYSPRSDNVLS